MGPREGSWWNFLCVIRILFRWLYLWWHCSSKRWTYPWLREKCEQDFLHNSESKNPCGKNIIGYFRRNSILLLARLLTKPSGSIMNEIRLSQNIPWSAVLLVMVILTILKDIMTIHNTIGWYWYYTLYQLYFGRSINYAWSIIISSSLRLMTPVIWCNGISCTFSQPVRPQNCKITNKRGFSRASCVLVRKWTQTS